MSVHEGPYIPADQEPKELTIRVLVVGVLLGILMTAANAYLGLYAGMTVSASIPAAVMSMLILRSMFKDVSILENNAVQTMASAGESLAAGVIFTVPAMLVIGIWVDIEWFPTLAIALLGVFLERCSRSLCDVCSSLKKPCHILKVLPAGKCWLLEKKVVAGH